MQVLDTIEIDRIEKVANKGAKILFANFPADGHFNPLTSLAAHLKSIGYDVRWYTSITYADKIKKIGVPHYPLKRALDISGGDPNEIFPDRINHKSQVSKLKFDFINVFILRGTEYYDDIKEIYETFQFDLMIADIAFTGIPFVKEHMNIPVISIGIVPLPETSKDLPPSGLGLTPSYTFFGKMKQAVMRFFADQVIFKKPSKVLKQVLAQYNIKPEGNLFDTLVRKSTMVLQSGTPSFEYYRSDLSSNIRFVGPLLPYSKKKANKWFDDKMHEYKKIIIVTQGTVEKDTTKIIVPTLEAFKGTDVLVIATTGGADTQQLKTKYPEENIIIEDFIPFEDVMPYADVYVTNGGYGGVLLGIQNILPLVVAGVHEGKNEINARVGYFDLGINLGTEHPTAQQVKVAVNKVLNDKMYEEKIIALSKEFGSYNPQQLCAKYVNEVLEKTKAKVKRITMAV